MPTVHPKWPMARRLKAARELAGLSVIELAEKTGAGLGRGPIQEIERGKRALVDAGEIARIARACGVSPSFFYIDFREGIGQLAPLPEGDAMDQMDAIQNYADQARKDGLS